MRPFWFDLARSLSAPTLVLIVLCTLPFAATADDELRIIRREEGGLRAAPSATPATLAPGAPDRRHGLVPPPSPDRAAPAGALPAPAAAPPAEIDALNPAYVELGSPGPNTGFGHSVSAVGDVNGDGFADVMVSSSDGTGFGFAAYLYRGTSAGIDPTPLWQNIGLPLPWRVGAAGDVNNDGYDDVLFYHEYGYIEIRHGGPAGLPYAPDFFASGIGNFGTSAMTAGDTNGDGYDDLIVGVPGAGQAVIYMGSGVGLQLGGARTLNSPEAPARFGEAVAGAGDINADGYDDVVVGAPDALDDTFTTGGAVFVYFGSATGIANLAAPTQKVTTGSASALVLNAFGAAVAPGGDYDGDGYADVLIGDPEAETGPGGYTGMALLLRGSPSGLTTSLIPPHYYPYGGDHDYYGARLFTAGDVNGDGRADVLTLVTAPAGGIGEISLFEGGTSYRVQVLTGFLSYGRLNATTAGDVNGDGFSDVVVGVPDASLGAGRVRIYYGRAHPPATNPAAIRYGGSSTALAGWAVAVGDVTGDGYDDVVVGSPTFDNADGTDVGKIDIYFGGPNGIAATPGYTFEGYLPGGGLGGSVDAGGDLNGDGYGEVLAGAPGVGYIYVDYGSPDWVSRPTGWILASGLGQFGASTAFAGDVNGDGFCDILGGAPYYDQTSPPTTDGGRVRLVYGAAFGLTSSPWLPICAQSNAYEGVSVASAGDVNADGYADILLGTPYYDLAGADRGHARLYLGGPSGPSNPPVHEWLGEAPGDYFGYSVRGIGDFTGEGYGDMAIGAPNYPGGGKAYIAQYGEDPPSITFLTPQASAYFGNAVAPAGDANGDGYNDLLVGAVFGDGAAGIDAGLACVFLGPGTTPTPYVTVEGPGYFSNVGHAVAGGGDVNGDGFGDFVSGVPRDVINFFDEGSARVWLGNSAHTPGDPNPVPGLAAPAQTTRPDFPIHAVAIRGRSSKPDAIGYEVWARSAGGRDRVAAECVTYGWSPPVTLLTPWSPMGALADPLQGAVRLTPVQAGLSAGELYAWKTRVRSRSPYFRFGKWHSPQPNNNSQWDFRTAPGSVGVGSVASLPATVELAPAYPNPARGEVSLAFSLPREMPARLTVRDLQGRAVQVLTDGGRSAGRHVMKWNGTDASGRACAAGLYFLDLEAGGERRAGRVVLTR